MSFFIILTLFGLSYALDLSFINYQSHKLIEYMKRIEEFPQKLKGEEIREWITQDRLPEGRLFIGERLFTEKDLENFMQEANLSAIPEEVYVRYGWTLRRTNMRMYPSDAVVHKGNPRIDYNQYTLLEPHTPLVILHSSKSGRWLYAHAPYMRGWVKREDVVFVERNELLKVMSLPFLVVAKGRVKVDNTVFGLGSKVYYEEKKGDLYKVVLPSGKRVWIRRTEGLEEGYTAFNERRTKSILDSLLGTPYDWGGKEGRWDCSSLVQSLYAIYGLELPRNSSQQAQIGRLVADSFGSYEEFKETLKALPPFRTLLFMRGHVMIYGGFEEGQPVIYHAVHKLRREDGSQWHVNSIYKNLLERDGLRNLYKSIIAVRVLD